MSGDCFDHCQGHPAPALTAVLDELDELRAKATAGEWGAGLPGARPDGMTNLDAMTRSAEYRTYAAVGSTREPADAALIVAAVNRLPELTAALRAVLAEHDGRTCCDRTFESLRGYEPCPTVAAIPTTALEAS